MSEHAPESRSFDGRMVRLYALVLIVEVAVISALWSFSRYFS